MENQEKVFVKIYVGVKYEDKDLAKSQGAKWNKENKKWYFKYILDDFEKDETKHTYKFKPYSIGISIPNSCADEYGDFERRAINQSCYNTAKNRNIKYIKENFNIFNFSS